MLDILVTVGVILVLIALAALLLHLINTHHEQRIAATHYERFHPGDPPPTATDRGEETARGEGPEQRDREGPERGP
ncbi:hypothetical protein G4Z16_17400 [Streptomyces bathyalis]|uniref:Uncharacterized protein n=1 Tax=Streptomyces bathyalis TaxID=2710756 RepID=A0A7T1WST7_9ACTN|nr:hypothetical protein [Streptomyces bathyalis]QPP07884.1 hypothetical protein G4Z16_17400 [Streptomyces bathyalis]